MVRDSLVEAAIDLATLGAGGQMLTLSGTNSRKSYTNEAAEVRIDDVRVVAR
jgi:hypothetical protein